MSRRSITCGFCQANNHRLCPRLIRAHRFTPKGKELREIRCACSPCMRAKPAEPAAAAAEGGTGDCQTALL